MIIQTSVYVFIFIIIFIAPNVLIMSRIDGALINFNGPIILSKIIAAEIINYSKI